MPDRLIRQNEQGMSPFDPGGEQPGAGQHANLVFLRQLHTIDHAGLAARPHLAHLLGQLRQRPRYKISGESGSNSALRDRASSI
jgi:hypothetical protein